MQASPSLLPRRSWPGTLLLTGAFVAGMLVLTHAGCGSNDCADADDGCTDGPDAGPAQTEVQVQILAFNDFHGQLEPAEGSGGQVPTETLPDGGVVRVNAGGAAYFAKHITDLRATHPNTVVVSAGDLIGATPLLSALFHDEPTVEVMNQIGLDISAVGNHEFDEGGQELLRMQWGGCHPVDGCQDGTGFEGARFKYLAANVATGVDRTLFPRYDIRAFEGVKLAFIGMTLEGTGQMVTPTGVAGLTFQDEVETVNALVPELKQQGVNAIVVVVHEGGYPAAGSLPNECKGAGTPDGLVSGAIVQIARDLDPAVDVVISGHTHQAYNCVIGGRLVTSAASVGRLVTDIDLTLDKATGEVKQAVANNVVVTRDVTPDSQVTELVNRYKDLSDPLANRVIGYVAETLKTHYTQQDPTGQATLGLVVADAQLAATKSANLGDARIAFVNPGGVRADLTRDPANPEDKGSVTYAEAFSVQPYGNNIVTLTLTGAQIERVLEQQWQSPSLTKLLHPSAGFRYTFDASAPIGSKVDPASIQLDGVTLDPTASYRVTVNFFLSTGGDGFSVMNEGTNRLGGVVDTDALAAYLTAKSSEAAPLQAPALDRITAINLPPVP